MSRRTRITRLCAGLTSLLLISSCAQFSNNEAAPWGPEPELRAPHEDETTTPPTPTTRAPGPCIDPDPFVVTTCLDELSGIVALPDGMSALVAERRTGRILRVAPDVEPLEVAKVDVDSSADGGLSDLAISPSFGEDHLIYAYVTTESDNRVVRIAEGDAPKDILTGLPKGPSGNAGAIAFNGEDTIVVRTGDAGAPGAGRVLQVSPVVPSENPATKELLGGLGAAGDVCTASDGAVWVTDRSATQDRLFKVKADTAVSGPAWTWPDRPGVAGCAGGEKGVAIALTGGRAVTLVAENKDTHAITDEPSVLLHDRFGQLRGASMAPDGFLWATTNNKATDKIGPNDDRVLRIPPPQGGGGGASPD